MAERDGLTTARSVAVAVFTSEIALLAATGLWLVFFYRPSTASAWPGIQHVDTALGWAGIVRGLHRLTAALAVPSALVTGVLIVVEPRRRAGPRPRRLPLVVGPALLIVTLAGSFTGYLLPWDQLGLWAVTVGTNMRGFGFLFGTSVRFALVDGAEITNGTLKFWFLSHTVVISVLMAAVLLMAWLPRRHERVSSARPPS